MFSKRVEEVSLNAQPALQHLFFDGWILRFSKGYTKRANSINPLFYSRLDTAEKVATSEKLYTEKGLPALCGGRLARELVEEGANFIDGEPAFLCEFNQSEAVENRPIIDALPRPSLRQREQPLGLVVADG